VLDAIVLSEDLRDAPIPPRITAAAQRVRAARVALIEAIRELRAACHDGTTSS
jgi:hypothetical protein